MSVSQRPVRSGAARPRIELVAGLWMSMVAPCLTGPLAAAQAVDSGLLPSAEQLQSWHALKSQGGPTFAGSPAWRGHAEFVETALRQRGMVDISRETVTYRRWYTADDPNAGDWSLTVDGEAIPVASYWAYSGSTVDSGRTARLLYYDADAPPVSVSERIVVFDVTGPPPSMAPAFAADDEFATPDFATGAESIASDQWYQSNYVTRFGRFDQILRGSGAAGGLVIFDLSPGRARGLYTFPLLSAEQVGVPGLYLDRRAGEPVRAAALKERLATMTLRAQEESATAWFLTGYLPGRNFGSDRDELVLLVTHSDGPNLTQENGTLGILAIIDYFAQLPREKRGRTLLVLLDPQHYMPGRHRVDWYADHPEIMNRVVASIGVEHLGQREYAERDEQFVPTGRPESTLIFVQDNDLLVQMAIGAVQSYSVPRTRVRVPARGGQGIWAGLGDIAVKRKMPGFAISSEMSAYWSTAPGLESFDSDLCYRQVGALVSMTAALMVASLEEIAVPVTGRGAAP